MSKHAANRLEHVIKDTGSKFKVLDMSEADRSTDYQVIHLLLVTPLTNAVSLHFLL